MNRYNYFLIIGCFYVLLSNATYSADNIEGDQNIPRKKITLSEEAIQAYKLAGKSKTDERAAKKAELAAIDIEEKNLELITAFVEEQKKKYKK